ncbi:trypsin-like peptidase domain-containing protein [Paludisphaera rhizosphaerae]|uniref:trypsin-like peptidase domain-containing protein n=1 Tax=Paludisphaera rhizosphaerae TaxID=2711216 RepID=UPI0013ECDB78|nr:trypsin-like peptidase domain-containing protein [Paludisphaera rhizosphaerae]
MSLIDGRDFFDSLRDLVEEGRLDVALDQLKSWIKSVPDRRLLHECILHISSLNDIRQKERQGLISGDDASVSRARLKDRVLEFIDVVDSRATVRPFPIEPISAPVPDAGGLEKILGAVSHLKSIAWLQRGLQASKAVGRVVTPHGMGSGFLLAGNIMVTNHHVIPDARTAAESRIEFNFEEDFGGRLQALAPYRLRPETTRVNEELDWCIVEVVDDPARPLGDWGQLEWATTPPKVGDHVTIVQHPAGGPKQVALTANQVVNIFDHRLQYTTDTLPGSSGSPVFNDAWKVVALHHAGGNLVANALGTKLFVNEGILASFIGR